MTRPILNIELYRIRTHRRTDYIRNRDLRLTQAKELDHAQLAVGLESFTSYTTRGARGVFMEITQWESIEALDAANLTHPNEEHDRLGGGRFTGRENRRVDLARALSAGQAVEFGVRRIKPERARVFSSRREDFMKVVKTNPGVAFDFELQSVTDDTTMVLFGWESRAAFEAASSAAKRSPRLWRQMLRYFPLLEQITFQVGVIPTFERPEK